MKHCLVGQNFSSSKTLTQNQIAEAINFKLIITATLRSHVCNQVKSICRNGWQKPTSHSYIRSGPKFIKKISCSTQLSMKFFLLINVKMPTIVSILTLMSRKNSILDLPEAEKS